MVSQPEHLPGAVAAELWEAQNFPRVYSHGGIAHLGVVGQKGLWRLPWTAACKAFQCLPRQDSMLAVGSALVGDGFGHCSIPQSAGQCKWLW